MWWRRSGHLLALVWLAALLTGGAWVQDETFSNDSGATATSDSKAFTSNVTAGNLIYVWGGVGGDITPSVSDTLANTYTLIRDTYDATNDQSHYTFYAKNIAGGANTVTISYGVASAFRRMGLMEISGLNTGAPLDVEVGAIDTTTSGVDAASAGTLVTTNATDFLVVSVQNIESNGVTWMAGTSYTLRELTGLVGGMETRTVAATGSYPAVFTGNANERSILHGVAFKDAGAAPAAAPQRSLIGVGR